MKIGKNCYNTKKRKGQHRSKNFRAISLLPNVSKVFKIRTNNMTGKECGKMKIIGEKQFGINVNKCEPIFLHPPVGKCNHNVRTNWRKFGIRSYITNKKIPTKDIVKYLSIYLDKFLYWKNKKAFQSYGKIFYSKYTQKM